MGNVGQRRPDLKCPRLNVERSLCCRGELQQGLLAHEGHVKLNLTFAFAANPLRKFDNTEKTWCLVWAVQ